MLTSKEIAERLLGGLKPLEEIKAELDRLAAIEERLRAELEKVNEMLLEEEKKVLPAGTSETQEFEQQFRITMYQNQIAFVKKMLGEE